MYRIFKGSQRSVPGYVDKMLADLNYLCDDLKALCHYAVFEIKGAPCTRLAYSSGECTTF